MAWADPAHLILCGFEVVLHDLCLGKSHLRVHLHLFLVLGPLGVLVVPLALRMITILTRSIAVQTSHLLRILLK